MTPEEKRERKRAYNRAYRESHPERYRAYAHTHRAAHREQCNAKSRAYYAAHREERKASNRAWAAENPEKRKAHHRAYRERHREEINARAAMPEQRQRKAAYARAYAESHQEELREQRRQYYLLTGRARYLASAERRESRERQEAKIAYRNSEEYRRLKLERKAAAVARKTRDQTYKTQVRECLFCQQTARFGPHQKYCSPQCSAASQRKDSPEQKKKKAVERVRAWRKANPERYRIMSLKCQRAYQREHPDWKPALSRKYHERSSIADAILTAMGLPSRINGISRRTLALQIVRQLGMTIALPEEDVTHGTSY